MSLMSLTAVALGKKVQAGEVTVEEAVLDALEQIELCYCVRKRSYFRKSKRNTEKN